MSTDWTREAARTKSAAESWDLRRWCAGCFPVPGEACDGGDEAVAAVGVEAGGSS